MLRREQTAADSCLYKEDSNGSEKYDGYMVEPEVKKPERFESWSSQ